MRHILSSLSNQTRWQIFARVLPVLILALLSIGAFSWIVFSRQVTSTVGGLQHDELAALLDNMSHRAALEALSFEAPALRGPDSCPAGEGQADEWSQFDSGLVAGIAFSGETEDSGQYDFRLADALAGPENAATMAAWLQKHGYAAQPGFRQGSWNAVRDPNAPILVHSPGSKKVYLFPPIILETAADQDTAGADPAAAMLPVLVRHEGMRNIESHHGPTFYFMDLRMLVQEFQLTGWWCALSMDERVLATSHGGLTVGSRLNDSTSGGDTPLFGNVDFTELCSSLAAGGGTDVTLVGDKLQPWVVTRGRGSFTPFKVLVAHEAAGFRTVSLRYLSMVLAVVLLALAVAVVGITRVVDGVSRSLDRLAISQDWAQRQALQNEETLRDTLDDMRLLDKAKDDFLVLISHEVRTPLTAIMGGVDFLKSSLRKVSAEDRTTLERLNVLEIAEIIESSGERLTGFMNDAIQMATIQSSDRQLKLKPEETWKMIELGLCGIRRRHAPGTSASTI